MVIFHERQSKKALEETDTCSHSSDCGERGLPASVIANAMNCGTVALVEFAKTHDISLDWLARGDLKGLLRTVRAMGQGGSTLG